MKFALCNEMYQNWPLERVCGHVASCGYEGIELAPFTLSPDPNKLTEKRAGEIGRIAQAAGLEVTALHWLLVKPEGLHVTTADAAVRKRTAEFLGHLARLCAAMGGKYLVFGSPKQRDIPAGVSHDEAANRAVEVFRQVCEVADPLGVTLALEPLGPAETNFLVSAAETIRLIERVGRRACRLHLDVKAMCAEDRPITDVIADSGAHLAYFHANDANRRGPGTGQVDFVPIFAALRRIHYDGYVSVEVFDYKPDPETIAEQSIAYLRRALAEAGQERP